MRAADQQAGGRISKHRVFHFISRLRNAHGTLRSAPSGLEFAMDLQDFGAPIATLRRPKTGGRKKGTPNKRTRERAEALAAIKASGKDPISFFADLLRNEGAPLELRFQAAKELAPYIHPRLTSVEARGGGQTHEDRIANLRGMLSEPEGGVP